MVTHRGSILTARGTGWPDYRSRAAGTTSVNIRAGAITTVSTITNIGTVSARRSIGTRLHSFVHLSAGSEIASDWYKVDHLRVKTFGIKMTQSGSHYLIGGIGGTASQDVTGTYDTRRIERGSFTSLTIADENLTFVRSIVLSGSISSTGKGTVQVVFRGQS